MIGQHGSDARSVCAGVQLILGVVLEPVLEIGGELDTVVDDHVHEVCVVSFDT